MKIVLGPIGDLASLLLNFGKNMSEWYRDLLVSTIQFMLEVSVPSSEEISSGFFSFALGGTLGLANSLIVLVIVLTALRALLSIRGDHSLRIARVISSTVGLLLFTALFYRVYALLYNLQQTLVQAVMNFMIGSNNATAVDVNNSLGGLDPLALTGASGLGWMFTFVAGAEAYGLRVLFLSVLWCYPVILVLRPIGNFFNTAFHFANAALLVVLVSPPFMVAFLLLPMWVSDLLPAGGLMGGVTTVVGGLLALATPIVFFMMAMTYSNKIFGNIDSKVAGAVDINSMPAFSMDDVNDSIRASSMAPMQSSNVTSVSSAPSGSLMGDIKGASVGAAAIGFTVAGHPQVAAAVKVADKAASDVASRASHKIKGGE